MVKQEEQKCELFWALPLISLSPSLSDRNRMINKENCGFDAKLFDFKEREIFP